MLTFKKIVFRLRLTVAPIQLGVKVATLAFAFALAACGAKMSGTYAEPNGLGSLTFDSGDLLIQETLGIEMEMPYRLDGKKLKVDTALGTIVYTVLDDHTLVGPLGIVLVKTR